MSCIQIFACSVLICLVVLLADGADHSYTSKSDCLKECKPKCEKKDEWASCYSEKQRNKTIWWCECYGKFTEFTDKVARIDIFGNNKVIATHDVADYHAKCTSNATRSATLHKDASSMGIDNTTISYAKNITTFVDEPCKNVDLDIDVWVLSGELHGEYCYYASNDWTFDSSIELSFLNHKLLDQNINLYPGKSDVSVSVNAGLVKGDKTVGVYGSDACLRIKGTACIWALGWQCTDFDEKIHCFG